MKAASIPRSKISVGLLECDPLRQVGIHSILDQIPEFQVMDMTTAEMVANPDLDVMLVGGYSPRFIDTMAQLRAIRPDVRVVVTGMAMDDEAVLMAIVHGAKGCVDESAATPGFAQAIKAVHEGSVWAPRRVMSMLLERSGDLLRHPHIWSPQVTSRQKQVLNMLVEGRSNKEIAVLMGIEVRTVKAHIASLLRKMGVRNRIALSMQAIKQSLVQTQ